LARSPGARLAFAPTPNCAAAAHAGACREADGARLEIAGEHARVEQLDALGALDVSLDLAADDHRVGAHAARQLGTGIDRQVALNVNVALEAAGETNVSRAFDLAFN